MERLSYLQRLGFDPTDCDNADNYYHPSDPLGPGISMFGRQHECTPSPRRPIPTDPFEAFRFFNRLQGLNERECTERHAFEYLNKPRPAHVKRSLNYFNFNRRHQQKCKQRKQRVEKPDIIESFEGDEISNLYFYHPLHEAMKKHPILSWLLGFEIVPGLPPSNGVEIDSSSCPDMFDLISDPREECKDSENLSVMEECENKEPEVFFVSDQYGNCNTHEVKEDHQKVESETDDKKIFEEAYDVEFTLEKVSNVSCGAQEQPTSFSSDKHFVAIVSLVRSGRLSTDLFGLLISMKGFIRLGVSLIRRDMEVVSQSLSAIKDLRSVVTEFASQFPSLV